MHVSINWHNYFCCALFVCVCVSLCMYVKSLQSCLTLCNAVDCSLPGFFVHGILQARTLKWVAVPSSRGSSPPRDQTTSLMSPPLTSGFFATSTIWEECITYKYIDSLGNFISTL